MDNLLPTISLFKFKPDPDHIEKCLGTKEWIQRLQEGGIKFELAEKEKKS